jgi:hypothetical protein
MNHPLARLTQLLEVDTTLRNQLSEVNSFETLGTILGELGITDFFGASEDEELGEHELELVFGGSCRASCRVSCVSACLCRQK